MRLLEKLARYEADELSERILNSITDYSLRVNSEKRVMEIIASFPKLIEKSALYKIEEQIRDAYGIAHVKILPKYSPKLFSYEYFPQILTEAERVGIVARGFFNKYKYDIDNNSITISIPFSESGIKFLEYANTPNVIERILLSEFDKEFKVKIVDAGENEIENSVYKKELERIDSQIVESYKSYISQSGSENAYRAKHDAQAPNDDEPSLIKVSSLSNNEISLETEDGICKIGHLCFDISNPKFIYDNSFEIRPVAISSVDKETKNLSIIGEVFGFSKDEGRVEGKFNISFSVFDGSSSVEVKKGSVGEEECGIICESIKNGVCVALKGYTKHLERRGVVDDDLTFFPQNIAVISKINKTDDADEKRIELHLHTNMSAMDALIRPDEIVYTAKAFGHPAVAITDHANVQAFPEAMIASEKCGMKVIYGMEAYFVNNTATALTGKYTGKFEDEAIVFDIETTGLSVSSCQIIEIGAVRIKNGEVVEVFDSFVNPHVPIPSEITQLTSITNDMVKDAPSIDIVLADFFKFIGNNLLIAHNANFDIGFIRHAAKENSMPFDNPYLDTLALSRFINPDLKTHKLDVLAKHYKLGDFNHHRASDDAEMLAHIYFSMTEAMLKMDISDFVTLNSEMLSNSDPSKLKSFHQIILVKNQLGLKNLYKLISFSYLKYFHRHPRIPKTELEKHREGLIIGSACEAGELFQAILEGRPDSEIENIVNFYDYLEIQPLSNNRFMIEDGRLANDEQLKDINRKIVELGKKYNKPVVATCDAHFMNDEDEIYRKILLTGMKFKDAEKDTHLYFRTTKEMLKEFDYLGEETAREVVIVNPNKINDMIDVIRPIPKGSFTPNLEGAEEELQSMCWERAHSIYGDDLPQIVHARLKKELDSIVKHGFSVLYMIAEKLVKFSEGLGYLVGSRGSVGSSFVATMAGISEVNPLPPHYYCPNCRYSEFITDGSVGSGFDLPDKHCPKCNTMLKADGHDIPFETFLGFHGDKSPDIDLNFSGDIQGRIHKYTEELFGAENVFRAGTLGTLADKTAYGFVAKYLEGKGVRVNRAEANRLVLGCVGVKRTTGQHPGGIIVVPKEYEIYDFSPVQHPADDPKSDIITTHFAFSYLHDTILKLDELGHDVPTKYKLLEKYSNTSVLDVPMNDKNVYELFLSTKPLGVSSKDIESAVGTLGLPEMGTHFIQGVLVDAKPKNFADLLQISGLTHGTNVWLGNAKDLITEGICDISRVIGTRDGIMLDLIRYGLDNSTAFSIMEKVRKGKGLTPEWEADMRAHGVPEWYITSCKKIKYMFPKAHAAAYVMSAIRLGWYKIYHPVAFYCAMFTANVANFDAEIVMQGRNHVFKTFKDIEARSKEASQKELATLPVLLLANECMARGIKFLPIDINMSEASAFVPENGAIRMPFYALNGIGENAAANIISARNEERFFSIEDLQIRASLSKTVIELMKRCGVLDGLQETDQLTLF